MIQHAADKLAEKLVSEKIILTEEKEVYNYGLQLLISAILKGSGLLALGYITGNILEIIIFVTTFGILRIFAGGVHAHSYLRCFIITVIFTYTSILLAHQFNKIASFAILLIILTFTNIMVYLYSPIDSPNKPLTDPEKMINRKRSIKTIIIGSFIIITIYIVNPIFHVLTIIASLGFFIEALTLAKIKQLSLFKKRGDKNESYV